MAFALLIGLYTYIFHLFYPVLENKPLSWASALLFVVDSMTTVGSGLPLTNDMTMLLAILTMISGVIMIFMVVPLLLAHPAEKDAPRAEQAYGCVRVR